MAQPVQDNAIYDAVELLKDNGFKDKTVKTRLGALPLKVPQTRDCKFYPQSLEKGLRSERALLLSIAEMYVQGVSTRRVKKIVEELCGMDVPSVSMRAPVAAVLMEIAEDWQTADKRYVTFGE